MSGAIRTAHRRYAALLEVLTGLPWEQAQPAGARTCGRGWPDRRGWTFGGHAEAPGYDGKAAYFCTESGTGSRRRVEVDCASDGSRPREYVRRDWPEVLAPVIAPVAVAEHNLWAAAVADALESCRGATIALLVGDIPDRRRPTGLQASGLQEVSWDDAEGMTLPPGYAIRPGPAGAAWRWVGERSGAEPWSNPELVEDARRAAWEDFWCRRPSLTSGA